MRIKKDNETVEVKIYELLDPKDDKYNPRYIGITSVGLKTRLCHHISDAKIGKIKCHRTNWISKLLSEGRIPNISLIESIIGWKNACNREIELISEYKSRGFSLVNSTIGGEGTVGHVYTEEQRKRFSEAHKGYVMSEEQKEKLRQINLGKVMSEDAKIKMRGKRIVSEEEHQRRSIWQKGVPKKRSSVEKMIASKTNSKYRVNN